MGRTIKITTNKEKVVVGKIKKKEGIEEILVLKKGEVKEIKEEQLTEQIVHALDSGLVYEVEEKPKPKGKKK